MTEKVLKSIQVGLFPFTDRGREAMQIMMAEHRRILGMHAADIDAWGGGTPKPDLTIDMDIVEPCGEDEYKAWRAAGSPQINGIKHPKLEATHDANGHLILKGNAEGLMVLRQVIEECLLSATFATHPGPADCLVTSCLHPRTFEKDFCIKLHIEDFRDNKARLAKIWTHTARKNGQIAEHHDHL